MARPQVLDQHIASQSGHGTTGGRKGGGDSAVSSYSSSAAGKLKGRARVETKPAEPQDKDTEQSQRRAVARHVLGFALGVEAAKAWAQNVSAGEGSEATSHVHDTTASEVVSASVYRASQGC